jgi:hypothetical protein
MKTKTDRRSFLKQSAILGGGLLLLGAEAQTTRAVGAEADAMDGTVAAANETLKTIGRLRTIHGNFLDKPIPEPELQTILKASVRAANASNMQSYSIVVVKDRKTIGEVCGYRGSCMLLHCVDFNRLKASAELMG